MMFALKVAWRYLLSTRLQTGLLVVGGARLRCVGPAPTELLHLCKLLYEFAEHAHGVAVHELHGLDLRAHARIVSCLRAHRRGGAEPGPVADASDWKGAVYPRA